MAQALTSDRLKELLAYDPLSGIFTWLITSRNAKAGRVAGSAWRGYIGIGVDGRTYRAHRLAWLYSYGAWPTLEIDHINGDRADNRLQNLREAATGINAQNVRKARRDNRSSGLLGAHRAHGNKWQARIFHKGRSLHLGTFPDPQAAHAAYVEAKRRLHAGCTI